MSKARVIVSAVIVEGRSKTEVARDYGVARSWVYTLVGRYLEGGWDAIEPRSKRPTSNPRRISTELESEIVRLRQSLTGQGHDAGAHTIAFHLTQRNGLIHEQPRKRPRSSPTATTNPNEKHPHLNR